MPFLIRKLSKCIVDAAPDDPNCANLSFVSIFGAKFGKHERQSWILPPRHNGPQNFSGKTQHHAADDDTERKTESSTEALSTFPSIQLIHYIEEERRMIA
jgi:hypothetical protein